MDNLNEIKDENNIESSTETSNEENDFSELNQEYTHNVNDGVKTDNTVWKDAISKIIIGIILNFFVLNFLGLNIILPMIGLIFTYMGINSLKNHNQAFNKVYIWGLILVLTKAASLIFGAFSKELSPAGFLFGIAVTLINVGYIHYLRTAINGMYVEKNVYRKRDPLLQIIIFFIVVLVGTLTVFLAVPLLAVLVFIWAITIIVDLVKFRNETIELPVVVNESNTLR